MLTGTSKYHDRFARKIRFLAVEPDAGGYAVLAGPKKCWFVHVPVSDKKTYCRVQFTTLLPGFE